MKCDAVINIYIYSHLFWACVLMCVCLCVYSACVWRAFQLVAIYNYNPLKDSPNLHPSRELALREGDTVMLLGNPRNDGFCQAEVGQSTTSSQQSFTNQLAELTCSLNLFISDHHVYVQGILESIQTP